MCHRKLQISVICKPERASLKVILEIQNSFRLLTLSPRLFGKHVTYNFTRSWCTYQKLFLICCTTRKVLHNVLLLFWQMKNTKRTTKTLFTKSSENIVIIEKNNKGVVIWLCPKINTTQKLKKKDVGFIYNIWLIMTV